MYRAVRFSLKLQASGLTLGRPLQRPIAPTFSAPQGVHGNATMAAAALPCLEAPDLASATRSVHVHKVSEELERSGMLKIRLGFSDDKSEYLNRLLHSLHQHHGHQLPITHSATCGWFWDVRPKKGNFQAGHHQARSETTGEFPWHTDCSYEDPPPRYFALQVLQHDRHGGGILSVMNVDRLSELLSTEARDALARPEFRISIPPEFIKHPSQKHIVGSVITAGRPSIAIRFREDILTPLTDRAGRALAELKHTLQHEQARSQATVHLRPADLPRGSIILMDNRRWLHARNTVRDPERHLRRVRWHATPFDSV